MVAPEWQGDEGHTLAHPRLEKQATVGRGGDVMKKRPVEVGG